MGEVVRRDRQSREKGDVCHFVGRRRMVHVALGEDPSEMSGTETGVEPKPSQETLFLNSD